MRRILLILCLAGSFWFLPEYAGAQVSSDYAVMVSATIDTSTPSISLKWPLYVSATSYSVYRKSKTATTWGLVVANPPAGSTGWTDYSVVIDSAYEYKVLRAAPTNSAQGYIFAGMNLSPLEHRGTCILLVDSILSDSLQPEILRLMKDISHDGWAIIRHDVSRNESVSQVRALITADYNLDPSEIHSLLLLGHIPVPYSGDMNPDGHPDHKGAWPADPYYADINGNFTDTWVDDTVATRPENRNIPGDGKFDQTTIPTNIELQCGRVDMYNLPAFALSEVELTRRYLNKNHDFRNKVFYAQPRGLIDDNFGAFAGEAFASGGWRGFPPMFGDTAVKELDFFTTLSTQDYLWAYGCGGGSFQGAGGIGSTSDFAANTVNAVFTMLFGSYFGDWDSQNNFLRAPLASAGTALTCSWSGRPHWHFHHMALGENIGYSTMLTQNNTGTYLTNYGAHWVHAALMGDPTLRLHPIVPPTDLVLNNVSNDIELSWTSSTDNVLGYYVYRGQEEFGKYIRISPDIIMTSNWTDLSPENGINYYIVRAIRLEETPSGSYYNLSTGISDSVSLDLSSLAEYNKDLKVAVYPNPATTAINIQFEQQESGYVAFSLIDLFGRTVLSEEWPGGSSSTFCSLEIADIPAGFYILIVQTDKGIARKTLEVIR